MDNALFIAASGMDAVQRLVDNSSHNTVNALTPGYQKHTVILRSFGSFLDDAGGDRGPLIGVEELVKFEQGELLQSESPYSVALQGDGFFTIRDGRGQEYFTRNGDFTLNAKSQLVTRAGYPAVDAVGQPIVVNPLGGPIQFRNDGTVVQNEGDVGKLAIVEFERSDRAKLIPAAETLFEAPEGTPKNVAVNTTAHQGFLEQARDGGMKNFVTMMMNSKNYESMQKAIRVLDQLQETLIRSAQ